MTTTLLPSEARTAALIRRIAALIDNPPADGDTIDLAARIVGGVRDGVADATEQADPDSGVDLDAEFTPDGLVSPGRRVLSICPDAQEDGDPCGLCTRTAALDALDVTDEMKAAARVKYL